MKKIHIHLLNEEYFSVLILKDRFRVYLSLYDSDVPFSMWKWVLVTVTIPTLHIEPEGILSGQDYTERNGGQNL